MAVDQTAGRDSATCPAAPVVAIDRRPCRRAPEETVRVLVIDQVWVEVIGLVWVAAIDLDLVAEIVQRPSRNAREVATVLISGAVIDQGLVTDQESAIDLAGEIVRVLVIDQLPCRDVPAATDQELVIGPELATGLESAIALVLGTGPGSVAATAPSSVAVIRLSEVATTST